jgi:AraC-like DNA-binding protein
MHSTAAFRFSTDDLPERDRLPVWCEVMGRQHMRLDIELSDPATVWAALDVHHLPAAEITCVQSDPAVYRRTRQLANDGNGDFTFTCIERGGFRVVSDDAGEDLAAGDGALIYHGVSGVFDVTSRARVMAARFDGDMVRNAVRGLDERLLHRLPGDTGRLRLLKSYMSIVMREGVPQDAALAHLVNAHLIDLLALCLRPGGEARERAQAAAVPAARLAALRADIVASLSQVRLSARTIARQHGLSERYVHLLFEQTGLSFSRFVNEERLKRAMAMLLDPACAEMKIGDIAFAVGFGELTTFNRAFRRRYGDTPSAVRRGRKGEAPS